MMADNVLHLGHFGVRNGYMDNFYLTLHHLCGFFFVWLASLNQWTADHLAHYFFSNTHES
jgi:hypothetical protein